MDKPFPANPTKPYCRNVVCRSCAANDFENIGGGYVIVGVEEENERAKRPVTGIPTDQLDTTQKEMIGFNNLIRPYYAPKLSIETLDDQHILVIWILAGMNRPYEVPEKLLRRKRNTSITSVNMQVLSTTI